MKKKIGLTLVVDSKGLHRCLSTQSTPRDRGMIADVHRLRSEYERGDIDDIVWVAGTENPADALTKLHAGETAEALEKMLVEDRLAVSVNNLREYGPALLKRTLKIVLNVKDTSPARRGDVEPLLAFIPIMSHCIPRSPSVATL